MSSFKAASHGAATPPMTAERSPLDRSLMRRLFWTPLISQKARLGAVTLALLGLALSQGLTLVMIQWLEKALFATTSTGSGEAVITVGDLLPSALKDFTPQLAAWKLSRSTLAVIVPAGVMVAVVMRSIASYVYQLHQQAIALFMAKHYRDRLFETLLSLPYAEIKRRSPAAWMSVVMNDVMFLQMRFSDLMTGVVRDSVKVVACFVTLALLHWPTAVVLATLAPFAAWGMGRTGRRIARYAEAFQREMAKLASAVLDLRARFDFIRAQAAEARERQRFAALAQAYYEAIRRSILVRSAFAPLLELLGFTVLASIVYAVGNGYWHVGGADTLLVFFGALGLLLKPLREIGEQVSRLQETRGALADSLSLFRKLQSLKTPVADANLPDGGGALNKITITSIRAGMADEVRFQAEGLRLTAGRTIAVIGPSGAGKSTLLKTLAGLVEPLHWDADTAWRTVSAQASMVSQEPFLFDDTIAANLRYGLDQKPAITESEIWSALELVNIAQEIKSLPDGLGTRVRAITSNVSGGQLQRLVIARSILRRKSLWLLDEATSAIDARSEKDITLRLIAACREQGAMLLAATHRLQWLDAFDEVWFVDGGTLRWQGPHAKLLEQPRYRDYCAAAHAGAAARE